MSTIREKFATQVSSKLLEELRALAKAEGRQLQALIDEAIEDLIDKHQGNKPRAHIMKVHQSSHKNYARLYKKLAQ